LLLKRKLPALLDAGVSVWGRGSKSSRQDAGRAHRRRNRAGGGPRTRSEESSAWGTLQHAQHCSGIQPTNDSDRRVGSLGASVALSSRVASGALRLSPPIPRCSMTFNMGQQLVKAERYSTRTLHSLSHVSADGKTPQMVDVSDKRVTKRTAWAQARVQLPATVISALTEPSEGQLSDAVRSPSELVTAKGPVFATAIIAGVMGAKRTSEVIPFCHPLPLDNCKVDIRLDDSSTEAADGHLAEQGSRDVIIDCRVTVTHKTGVEMEALTGASTAALCIYDMCKAMSHDIIVKDLKLVEKTGGKKDYSRSPV